MTRTISPIKWWLSVDQRVGVWSSQIALVYVFVSVGVTEAAEELALDSSSSETITTEKPYEAGLVNANLLQIAGEYSQAIVLYEELAEKGSAEAMLEIGRIYEQGRGVEQDDVKAAFWLGRAAEQGQVVAQYELGVLYVVEDSAILDFATGLSWFRKAAEKGHADAQFNVGVAYEKGFGNQIDQQQAIRWFRRAAEQGHDSAEFKLAVMYLDGVGIPNNQQAAIDWFRKAANHGNAVAQLNMGQFYLGGIGVTRDLGEAERWLEQAADQGEDRARKLLADMRASASTITKQTDYVTKPSSVQTLGQPVRRDERPVRHSSSDVAQGAGSAEDLTWETARKENTIAAYDSFLKSYGESKYAREAIDRRGNLRSDEKMRKWIKEISVSILTAPQPFWGGLELSEAVPLSCVISECDQMFMQDKPPTLEPPREGNVFIVAEAVIATSGTDLTSNQAMHIMASLQGDNGREAVTHVWHQPSDNPEMAGWTTVMYWVVLRPRQEVRLKWLYQVPQDELASSRFILFGREQLIQ